MGKFRLDPIIPHDTSDGFLASIRRTSFDEPIENMFIAPPIMYRFPLPKEALWGAPWRIFSTDETIGLSLTRIQPYGDQVILQLPAELEVVPPPRSTFKPDPKPLPVPDSKEKSNDEENQTTHNPK